MTVKITTHFAFETEVATDLLLQFEAAQIPEQALKNVETTLTQSEHCARVAAEDDIGERVWIRSSGRFDVNYTAEVEVNRLTPDISTLGQMAPHDMPGEAVHYMLDSRYCPADRFQSFVEAEFGDTSGGARVMAIRQWIADNFSYVPGASNANTTGEDSFIERRGICRDYAHVLIMLARASTIPARYVSCYAPRVTPQDFHAVAEVFLADPTVDGGGAWHIVDATDMADPGQTVKIGVGRDAADVSFLTSFGPSNFLEKTISVETC